MKILQVITSLQTGGAEKLIVDIAPLLRSHGHEVEIAILNGEDTPFKGMLQKQGITIHDLSIGGSVYSISHVFKLCKFFSSFDIIHTHNFTPQYFAAFARFLSRGKAKCVTTEHNTHNRRRDIAIFKPIDHIVYKQYESIICISEKAEDNLKQYLKRKKNIRTICNGIALSHFKESVGLDKKSAFGLSDDDFILIQVAGFREQKDQDCLIRALTHLPQHVHAVFLGDGVRRATCEALAHELAVFDRCHFLGVRTEVAQLLKGADIAVNSSHWEGLPLSTVEGMAAGLPVIASDVDGLKQLVDGAGLLFDVSNERQLAQLVSRLMEDNQLYTETSAKCLERAQDYDINTMVEAYEAEYKRVLHT